MIILTRRTLLAGTSALAAASLFSPRAFAAGRTYHALLVACTQYPSLPEKHWLTGPKNDAVLVRDFLMRSADPSVVFAPENIALLADEVEGATGKPTHEGIIGALDAIAAKVQRDDFVYLHLSGHGAQQPQAKAGDETDGLDEIFLPADIGKWADRDKGVPNALVDDEIGKAIDAIRNKGAFVWAIFDCCHSGTATRAAEVTDEAERKVEFADLIDDSVKAEGEKVYANAEAAVATRGFDEEGNRKAAFSVAEQPTSAEPITRGKLVAFYAAQTIETTPEMPLPKGAADATRYGLFTYTIFSKLAENPAITYRQLGQFVLQQYAADGRVRPTPLFEGELDARVFGTDRTDYVMQWPITVSGATATIAGGRLHRLTPGSKLAVLASPLAPIDDATGYLEISSAKNFESSVKPIAFEGKPAPKLADIPPNAYARITNLAVDYQLQVALPKAAEASDPAVEMVASVLNELRETRDSGLNIALVEPGTIADVRLAVLPEEGVAAPSKGPGSTPTVWFLPASGDIEQSDRNRPPRIIIHLDDRERLLKAMSKNLTTIFRATALSRLATADDYDPEVSLNFRIKRLDSESMETLESSQVPRVAPGDEMHVEVENRSDKYVDLNVLYVGSDYSIVHIVSERLASGATLSEGLLAFTDTSFGMERMIAVLTEAPPQSEKQDLSFLAQEGVPALTRSAGGGGGALADMLADIGMAPSTRSIMKLPRKGAKNGNMVRIYPVETVPRSS